MKNNHPASISVPRLKKVLLIEDDPSLKEVFHALLAGIDENIQMDWVTNAEEAIDELEESSRLRGSRPFDLVISDVFLDGKFTGVDFWRLCRKVYPNLPVVVVSSLPSAKLFDFIEESQSAIRFLQKPLDLSECKKKFQEFLC